MSNDYRIHFVATQMAGADEAMATLQERYGQHSLEQANVIVALGDTFKIPAVYFHTCFQQAAANLLGNHIEQFERYLPRCFADPAFIGGLRNVPGS